MNTKSSPAFDVNGLRHAGRSPEVPFRLVLGAADEVVVDRLLRVLPGKRVVGHGVWRGQSVLAKIFVAESSARHWLPEKKGIEMLHRAGVPTPRQVLANSVPGGGHLLLTEFMGNARSLEGDWAKLAKCPAGTEESLSVLRPVFHLLGRMHAHHLVHLDLHPGNFLSTPDDLYVIDGGGVQTVTGNPATISQQLMRNLALLLSQLPEAWIEYRQELLAAYRSSGVDAQIESGTLETETQRYRDRRLASYLAKTVRDCTLFLTRQTWSRFLVVRRDTVPSLAKLLDAPDRYVKGGGVLKDGQTCTVVRVETEAGPVVIKRYNLKGARHALSRFWRPSRAWHSWRAGHRLAFLGIATPEPLALIEERFGLLRRRAYLISEHCPGVPLTEVLFHDSEPEDRLGKALLGMFSDMHRKRITHGDLKASNLLWHDERIVLLDLDACVQHRADSAYLRAWRRDRLRFLKNWPDGCRLRDWLDRYLPHLTVPVRAGNGARA